MASPAALDPGPLVAAEVGESRFALVTRLLELELGEQDAPSASSA